VRRHHPHSRVARTFRQDDGGPARLRPRLPDRDQRAHQRPDHVVAERVRHHRRHRYPGRVPPPLKPSQRPHRRRPLTPSAERGEIMLAEQPRRRRVHRRQVKPPGQPHRPVPLQRIGKLRIVADPVRVPPPQRGEPRIEPGRCPFGAEHPQIVGQHPAQPVQEPIPVLRPHRVRHQEMSHLPPRMHPRVGPPGHGQPGRLPQPQHPRQRLRERSLHGPPPRLCRPPREPVPVVPQQQLDHNGSSITHHAL
jgi:hypothetical protein